MLMLIISSGILSAIALFWLVWALVVLFKPYSILECIITLTVIVCIIMINIGLLQIGGIL